MVGAPGAGKRHQAPGARVVLTERTGGAGSSEEGDADVPATVRVPALADLRGEPPVVVREVAAELLPGAPAPRFSPAELQSLLAWPWPGNVAELRRVLAALPQVSHGGPVRTQDLPVPMRQSPRSPLSRCEQAERDAIDAALREAGATSPAPRRSWASAAPRSTGRCAPSRSTPTSG